MEMQRVDRLRAVKWIKRIDQRLIRNVGYVGISNVIYAASQWGIMVLVTKLSNIENVARLSLGLAVVTPIMLFLGAGLRVFISIDVQRKYAFGDYIGVRIITSLIGFLAILLFGFISGYSQNALIVIFLIAAVKVIEGFQEVCWGINQRVDFMDPVGISRLLRSVTCLLAIALGLLISGDLIVGILLWIAFWLLILFAYDLPHARRTEPLIYRFEGEKSKRILTQIIPLALISGLVALNDKATQYQIAGLLGESAVGYYSPLAYVIQGVGLGITSIAESTMPRLAMYYHSNRKGYVRGTLLLIGTGALIGTLVMIVFGLLRNTLLPLLYTREFLNYGDLFLLLLVIGIIRFTQTGLGVAVTSAGRFYQQAPHLIFSLLIVLVTGWLLIPLYGLNGAAYSVGFGTIYLLISFLFLWVKSISGAVR